MRYSTRNRRRIKAKGPDEYEIMAAGCPLALFALVGLTFDLLNLTVNVPAVALEAVLAHVAALFGLWRKPSAVKIAEILGGMEHDSLTRLVFKERWAARAIVAALAALAQCIGGMGYLVIDDTCIVRPRGKKVEGAYWDYDHALGKSVLGYRMVTVLWVCGPWRIPLAFSFWHKRGARRKYRTKNEIARILLAWVVRRIGPVTYVAFDSWYANRKMFALCEELGLEWVTRVRRNTKLTHGGRRLRADTIGRRLLKAARPYRRAVLSGGVARKAVVNWGQMGPFGFVVLKDELDGEKEGLRYLLSSSPDLSAAGIALRYKSRWEIEVFFESLKQHFWLNAYQGRTLAGQRTYVALAFLAHVCAQYWSHSSGCSVAQVKDWASRLWLIEDEAGEPHLTLVRRLRRDHLPRIAEAKEIVRNELPELLHFQKPLIDFAAA